MLVTIKTKQSPDVIFTVIIYKPFLNVNDQIFEHNLVRSHLTINTMQSGGLNIGSFHVRVRIYTGAID